MLSTWRDIIARVSAFGMWAPMKRAYVERFAILRRPLCLAVIGIASFSPTGCSQFSKWARPSAPPPGIGPYPNNAANTHPPANRTVPPGNPAFAPMAGQRGQPGQVVNPTGPASMPVRGGPASAPEVVATPRPDGALPDPPALSRVPPAMPPIAPGQSSGFLRPAPKPACKWRGFLPAHGTNEDRPGWWTPDYGGGTSA